MRMRLLFASHNRRKPRHPLSFLFYYWGFFIGYQLRGDWNKNIKGVKQQSLRTAGNAMVTPTGCVQWFLPHFKWLIKKKAPYVITVMTGVSLLRWKRGAINGEEPINEKHGRHTERNNGVRNKTNDGFSNHWRAYAKQHKVKETTTKEIQSIKYILLNSTTLMRDSVMIYTAF